MRYIIISLLALSALLAGTPYRTSRPNKIPYQASVAKRLYEIPVSHNVLTRGFNDVVCDIANDTLYFINNAKLVKMSLKNGRLSTDAGVNSFLAGKKRGHREVSHLNVVGNKYLVNLVTELDLLSPGGKVNTVYAGKSEILDDVPVGENILMATYSGVELINMEGKQLENGTDELSGHGFYHTLNGLGNTDDPKHIIEFKIDNANKIKKIFYPSTDALKSVSNDLFVCWADDRYLFMYNDANRDNIFMIRKGENKIMKTFPLGVICEPSGAELADEEGGEPNFRMIPYNGEYYIIAFAHQNLVVLRM